MRNVIAAQPGFELIYVDADEPPAIVLREPVIAWEVEILERGERDIEAICPSGSRQWHALQYPDGKIYDFVSEETFDDLAGLIEHHQWREKQRKNEQAGKGLA